MKTKNKEYNIWKRMLSVFMVAMLLIGFIPARVNATNLHSNQVRVIVDNNTYLEDDAPWTGNLVDTWVDLETDDTGITVLVKALATKGYTCEGAESNYISSVNGLSAGSAGGWDGFMVTLNDWFTNEGIAAYTVANGKLQEGDEIHMSYSMDGGEDLGGYWSNNDKTIKTITFDNGTLDKTFSSDVHSYNITVDASVDEILVTPTAANKNFLVKSFIGSTEYRRTQRVPVEDGTVIKVVCGDTSWPTMNGGEYGDADSVPGEEYTFTVVKNSVVKSELESLIVHTSTAPAKGNVLIQNSTDSYEGLNTFSSSLSSYDLGWTTDTVTQLRFRAKPKDSTSKVELDYGTGTKDITWASGTSKWANCLTPGKNTLKLTVSSEASSTDVPTEYVMTIEVRPTLKSINASYERGNLYLNKTFSATSYEYTIDVPDDAHYIDLSAVGKNSTYKILYNNSENSRVSIDGLNMILVKVIAGEGDKVATSIYTINLNRNETKEFSFNTTPADARVNVYDSNKKIVKPDADGTYSGMLDNTQYSYEIGKARYVSVVDTVPTEGGIIDVNLSKTPESTLKDVGATWKNFRNSQSNMGITDKVLPTIETETNVKWTKKLGTGWSASPSVQIIVDNSLVTMCGKTLYKLDLATGEVIDSETMASSPSYGYTPPTYVDGMILCPLGGGIIQAFNAETLDPLWIYTDKLGGQALSPIADSDGMIYVGFWNGEGNAANFVTLSTTDEDVNSTNEEKIALWTVEKIGGYYWAGATTVGNYVIVGGDDGTSGFDGASEITVYNKYTGQLVDSEAIVGDQRSCIAYDDGKIYFTTKCGYLYSASFNSTSGDISNLKGANFNAQTTSTPVVYGDRIYFATGSGISSSGSSGYVVVVDKDTLTMLDSIEMLGYPQCSLLISTAYSNSDKVLYLYSTYNANPGGITMVKADLTSDTDVLSKVEIYDATGCSNFCITSPICDDKGNIYYKNDSGNVICVGLDAKTFVEKTIDTLGEISLYSKDKLEYASKLYEALSEDDKVLVSNYGVLKDANATYEKLVEDKQKEEESKKDELNDPNVKDETDDTKKDESIKDPSDDKTTSIVTPISDSDKISSIIDNSKITNETVNQNTNGTSKNNDITNKIGTSFNNTSSNDDESIKEENDDKEAASEDSQTLDDDNDNLDNNDTGSNLTEADTKDTSNDTEGEKNNTYVLIILIGVLGVGIVSLASVLFIKFKGTGK